MARDFNGSSNYLSLSEISALNGALPFTVAALVWTDTTTGNHTIITEGDQGTTAGGWVFRIQGANLSFTAIASWGQTGTATTALSTGAWYGVAATKASGSNNITYYRYTLSSHTMASESVNTFSSATPSNVTETPKIGAGSANDAPFEYWDGRLARIGVWMGTLLTQADLEAFFLTGLARWDSLDAYYELFGTSSPEPDWSINANHATLTDAPTRIDHPPGVGFPMMRPRRIWKIPTAADLGARNLTITHYT